MRQSLGIAFIGLTLGLTACGTLTPTGRAWLGRPQPLIEEVLAGRVDPNSDNLTETGQTITRTPLCVLAPLPEAAEAVNHLLMHGADVNKPCSAVRQWLPVDAVMAAIYLALAEKSPRDPEKYDRENVPAHMKMLKTLIDRGGTSFDKSVRTMDQAGVAITRLVAQRNQTVAEQLEDIRVSNANDRRSSWFSTENLGALVAIVGGSVNNYAAAKNSGSVTGQLPLAIAQASSSRVTAQLKTTAAATGAERQTHTAAAAPSQEKQARALTASNEADVVERNEYEKYPKSPNSWGSAINGWLVVTDGGVTRKDACSAAAARQTQSIEDDEANGYLTLAQRTGCICGSFRVSGNMTYAEPRWTCGAYHKMRNTGKSRGNVVR